MSGFRTIVNLIGALSCACLLLTGPAFAGRPDKAGTAAAPELLIPVGARTIALGGSTLSVVGGAEAMYWNPAGIVHTDGLTGVMFSHMNYLADIKVEYLAVIRPLGDIATAGLSVKSLSFGDIPITTEDAPDGTGAYTSPSYVTVGGAIARQLTDRISFGFLVNLIMERMESVSATGIGFSGGLQYTGLGGIEGLSVGIAVKNFGPTMMFNGDGLLRSSEPSDVLRPASPMKVESAEDDLPSTIEVGLGYTMAASEGAVVNLSSTFQNNNYSADEYRFGAEFIYREFLSLRIGYDYSSREENNENIFGPCAGVGVRSKFAGIDVLFDYAYRSVRYFSGNHVITLTIGF